MTSNADGQSAPNDASETAWEQLGITPLMRAARSGDLDACVQLWRRARQRTPLTMSVGLRLWVPQSSDMSVSFSSSWTTARILRNLTTVLAQCMLPPPMDMPVS